MVGTPSRQRRGALALDRKRPNAPIATCDDLATRGSSRIRPERLTLDTFDLVYISVITVLSYAVRGSTGFGTLTIALMALVLPIKIVAPTVTFLGLIASLAIAARDRRHIVWPAMWGVLPYCVAGVLLGLYLFTSLSTHHLRIALGVFVFGYGIHLLAKVNHAGSSLHLPQKAVTVVAGTVGGCVGTMFGTGGALFAIYFDLLNFDKNRFRATIAASLLALGIFRAIGYTAVGAVTADTLALFAIMAPFMLLGTLIGNRIHAAVNQVAFTKLVGSVMIVSAIPLALH